MSKKKVIVVYQYPKNIQTIAQLLQKWSTAGMQIDEDNNAQNVLNRIGYYRLKGYAFHLTDPTTGNFQEGTTFSKVVSLYEFDVKLSHLIFNFLSSIEVSLRARLVSALLSNGDALILNDPSFFKDKEKYWKNQSSIALEIARSNDVFIKHNYANHDGAIPLWATVEVMSFGTLSKVIKNLKPGNASHTALVECYKVKSTNGNLVSPSHKMFTSWIQAVSVMRNICAHNSRIYNRVISTTPELALVDRVNPPAQYNGLYQILLAMKYLRPTDDEWNSFVTDLNGLLSQYTTVVEIGRLNFPSDWATHFQL